MNPLATSSEWESDVLGLRVGVISSDKIPAVDAVRAVNRESFDVVFVSCQKWVEQGEGRVAIDYLYDMEMLAPEEKAKTSCISTITFPGKKHIDIARNATVESRFMRDPLLSGKSQERYVRWLTDHQAYVPVEAPDSAFLVPVNDKDGARRISLIVVDTEVRGTGIGTRLVRGAFSTEPSNRLWRVKVSARNRRALRFYETIGFRVKSVSTVFHVWISK